MKRFFLALAFLLLTALACGGIMPPAAASPTAESDRFYKDNVMLEADIYVAARK